MEDNRAGVRCGWLMAAVFVLSACLGMQQARAQGGVLEEANRSLAAGRELAFEVQDEVAEARYLAGVDDAASQSHAARARERSEQARARLQAVRERVERGRSSGDLGHSSAVALLSVCDRHLAMVEQSMGDLAGIPAGVAAPAVTEPAPAPGMTSPDTVPEETTPADPAPSETSAAEPAPGESGPTSGKPDSAEPLFDPDLGLVRLSEQERDKTVGIIDGYRQEIAAQREAFERSYADPGAVLRAAMDARGLPQDIELNAWANSLLCRVLDVKNWYSSHEGILRTRRDHVSASSSMVPDLMAGLDRAISVFRGYEASLLTAMQSYVDARADLALVYHNRQQEGRAKAETLLAEREQAIIDLINQTHTWLFVESFGPGGKGSESRVGEAGLRRADQSDGNSTEDAGEGPAGSFLDRLRARHTVSDERIAELSQRPGERALMDMIHRQNIGRPMLENMLHQGGDVTVRTRPDEEMMDRGAVYDPADRSITVPARRLNADGSMDEQAMFQGDVLREMWEAYNDQTVSTGKDPLTHLVLDETKEWLRDQPVMAGDGSMEQPARAADVVTDFDRLAGEYAGEILSDLAPRHISLMQRLRAGLGSGRSDATRDAYRQWNDHVRNTYGPGANGGAAREPRRHTGRPPPSFNVQSRPPQYLVDHLTALAGLGDFAGDR